MRSFHFFSEGTCSFTKRLHLRACWSWVDTWKREGTRSMNYWWWLRNPEVSSEKWCFLDPKWCSILLAWSLSWQNWPLKFKRTSPRRQWPRRWFLWAVCRTISSALSWIPSLMIFEIRFLFVVCRLSFVYVLLLDFASILRLLVAVGFNGHWWCSYATSDQCNWYDLASVVSPTKRCTYTFVQWCCFHMVFYLLNKAKMLEFTATETKRSH